MVIIQRQSTLGYADGTAVAIWGHTFKLNTDDMHEVPSRKRKEGLREGLCAIGAKVQVYGL